MRSIVISYNDPTSSRSVTLFDDMEFRKKHIILYEYFDRGTDKSRRSVVAKISIDTVSSFYFHPRGGIINE